MKPATFALVLASVLVVPPAVAVDEAALKACRALADDGERLACYDREIDRGKRAAASAPPAPPEQPAPAETPAPAAVSAPAEASAPLTAEERFGRERVIANAEREREAQAASDLGELKALVEKIETRIDGLMTITLDNGQVWRQNRPNSMFRLKVGDPVKIQPAALNSYLMTGPSNRSTRVTRVK